MLRFLRGVETDLRARATCSKCAALAALQAPPLQHSVSERARSPRPESLLLALPLCIDFDPLPYLPHCMQLHTSPWGIRGSNINAALLHLVPTAPKCREGSARLYPPFLLRRLLLRLPHSPSPRKLLFNVCCC